MTNVIKSGNPPTFEKTLRDYFAAKALQSYMINCKVIYVNDGYIAITELENLADYSYQIADAMLKQHLKQK